MTKPIKPAERDREATEKRLLESIGTMIREKGFEQIGINAVAAQSGVSKILIYRYFGSVEGLMTAYLRQHDLWNNFPAEIPGREELPGFVKMLFREQIRQLRNDPVLRKLYRWELSSDNAMIAQLREQREKRGVELVGAVSRASGLPEREVAAIATLLASSITYLAMLGDSGVRYNDIPLAEDAGWETLLGEIDRLINDRFFSLNA